MCLCVRACVCVCACVCKGRTIRLDQVGVEEDSTLPQGIPSHNIQYIFMSVFLSICRSSLGRYSYILT